MDACAISKEKLPSRYVAVGPARAPHRSYLYAMEAAGGFPIGHSGPEASLGGPSIWPPKDGGIIIVDAVPGNARLAERRAARRYRETQHQSGAIRKYSQAVEAARYGAVTHSRAGKETHCHAYV